LSHFLISLPLSHSFIFSFFLFFFFFFFFSSFLIFSDWLIDRSIETSPFLSSLRTLNHTKIWQKILLKEASKTEFLFSRQTNNKAWFFLFLKGKRKKKCNNWGLNSNNKHWCNRHFFNNSLFTILASSLLLRYFQFLEAFPFFLFFIIGSYSADCNFRYWISRAI